MTHPLVRAVLLLVPLALLSTPALAAPLEDTTRLALQAGYRYQPNGRFSDWTEMSGYGRAQQLPGGPSVLALFGYRPRADLEVSIEIGWAFERFSFPNAPSATKPMQLNQIPITLALRWIPFGTGSLYPYLGASYGYLLNFFTDAPGGVMESHGSLPSVLAGGVLEISDRISLHLEYRYGYCRVELTNLGYLQAGGSSLSVGLSIAFPPEDRRLK